MSMSRNPDWTDEVIERFRNLWDAGVSTKEIGQRLGFNKNQIVGKRTTLGLQARPSPIHGRPAKMLPPSAAGTVTLPPLASAVPALFTTTTRIVARVTNPMGRAPTTTLDDEREIKRLHGNGYGYGRISTRTGFSQDVVRRVLGWVRSDRPRAPVVLAPEPVPLPVFHMPDPGQCLWLNGERPYIQCTERALAGEGVPHPWSYCACHRAICFVRRAA